MKKLHLLFAFVLGLGLIGIGCDPVTDDDDSADDDIPEYEGGMSLDASEFTYGCTVEVASVSEDQDPPPAGYFNFDVVLSGWAEDCWIEMFDDVPEGEDGYCEGWDIDGNPCDFGGETRPGWWMGQGDYGYDAATGHWDSWYLDLDYEMVWPPLTNESLFICENAGDPEFGTGNFWTYLGCCDAVTGDCEIVQLASWE